MTMDVLRADQRFVTDQPGIRTWHCFSAGAHYDPSRLGVGSLIGVDEHHVEPGAGFAEHAHRGVDIVSWVVSGSLRHRDDAGRSRVVRPGQLQVQITGSGLRHTEANAGDEPLVLVQMTLVGGGGAPSYRCASESTATVSGGALEVLHNAAPIGAGPVYAFVADGQWSVGGVELRGGDSASADGPLHAVGTGTLLVWRLTE